ncbi:MAG: hypothetical protein HY328_05010 [Chloroflexi bacterium]|nr:hypothetical protein [Chloroflexota bacterium]
MSYYAAAGTGDRWGIAKAKQFQAILAIEDGRYGRAEHLGHEALALFEENSDNRSKGVVCT